MKKRQLAALLMAIMMIFTFVACSSDPGTGTSSGSNNTGENGGTTESSTTDEIVKTDGTLSVMIWDANQEPGITQILSEFTDQTGISAEVQVVKWDEYWTLLSAGAEGGSLPDVFWMHSNESERYMSNDMLLDLTDRIAQSSEIDPGNYPDDIWGLYTYDEKYYAVPKDIDTIALWYNKTLFDEAGVDYPTSDWTWDDVYEAAKQITKEDGSVYGYCNVNSNNQAGWYNMVYDHGGYIISDDKKTSGFDDPKTIEAMLFMEKFITDGLMPSQEVMSETTEEVLFQSGKVAMVPQGSWMLAAYRDNEYTAENCDVIELPADAETGRRASIYNGLGWTASANTSMADEAWQLIEYLGSKDAQIRQAELGITMSAYKDTSDAWVNSSDFNLQAYLNMMDDMVIRPYSRTTVTWENATLNVFLKAWTQEITMEEACLEAATVMNEYLAEENE